MEGTNCASSSHSEHIVAPSGTPVSGQLEQCVTDEGPSKQPILHDSGHQHQSQQMTLLCQGLTALDTTAEQLFQLLQHQADSGLHLQQQQQAQEQQQQQHYGADDISSSETSSLVHNLQQQLVALQAEKQRVEADRQEMALKQGNYKGTIAQLEGALTFTERKVKDQLSTIEKLQAQVTSLTSQLQEAKGAAAQTPDRCRTAAKVLQAEADRAASHARNNEAQVRKLKQIVQLGARELSELLDFAEQERLTLIEKEQTLQQEINQTRDRLAAAESATAEVTAAAEALQQELDATKAELDACQTRVLELEDLLAASQSQLQQSEQQLQSLSAERDAIARNLVTAEAELTDVGEYSTKMFRQVRFISHMLDKNSTVLSKLPEFASLARDLRAFVAANASNWERRDTDLSAVNGTSSVSKLNGAASHMADTAISGARDVVGKA